MAALDSIRGQGRTHPMVRRLSSAIASRQRPAFVHAASAEVNIRPDGSMSRDSTELRSSAATSHTPSCSHALSPIWYACRSSGAPFFSSTLSERSTFAGCRFSSSSRSVACASTTSALVPIGGFAPASSSTSSSSSSSTSAASSSASTGSGGGCALPPSMPPRLAKASRSMKVTSSP
ncbi:hypothetical protein T492DRAFT_511054 [Pavlovales sp. CCMP2436]|nr:hypothetical protein T492DRAFT_511054 [Pavlovales sp. CCMP2436]